MGDSPPDPLSLERVELDDGLTLVRQSPPAGSPSFSATFVAPGGWAYEPARAGGLALLTSELAVAGAGRLDRAALARELDRRGGTLASDCAPESSEISLWGPSEHFAGLLPILVDAIRSPRFDPRELARLRRQIAERQVRERTQPDQRSEKELLRALFPPGHPYRETGLGSARSVGRTRPADLHAFHRAHYGRSGGLLVITSPLSLAQLERSIARAFDGWDSGSPPPAPVLPSTPEAAPVRREIRVPGGSQVEIRLGGRTLKRTDPSYPALVLANEVLGGRGTLSRLFQELREKRGLVYHTHSALESMRWGGYWTAEAGADPAKVAQVLKLIGAETARISEKPPPSEELDRVRESLIGSVELELETAASAHELAVEVGYYGLPTDYWQLWPTTLRAVTPREVQEAARLGLDAGHRATIVAGPLLRPSSVV